MQFILWALNEIKVYGFWLLPFLAAPTLAAWRFKWKGVLAGHALVAFSIALLDYRWIQSEMGKPGWDGLPDMDIVFYFGVLARIATVNALSLPCAIATMVARRRRLE